MDLSGVTARHHVLLVAVAGSTGVDPCGVPAGLPAAATVADLVRRWP